MVRGDIVLVNLPSPFGKGGHEQIGQRPAVIVHDDRTSKKLPVIMIVPLTTNKSTVRFPHTIEINPSPQNGLSDPSVIMIFQLRAIDRDRIGSVIGSLEQNVMRQIESEIRDMLGL